MSAKVVLEHRNLKGSSDPDLLQRFATVYVETTQYRLYAPAEATGDPLFWIDNSYVRTSDGLSETEITSQERTRILGLVHQQLWPTENDGEGRVQPKNEGAKVDSRKVFVVYGRNSKARSATFDFLRAIDLSPMEWEQVIAATGKPSPFIGEALDAGFSIAQAAVVILTGDDMARLGKRYLEPSDSNDERVLTPQPRSNVIFEAGMALGKYPDRTVLISLGSFRKFSDVDGRHIVQMSDKVSSR